MLCNKETVAEPHSPYSLSHFSHSIKQGQRRQEQCHRQDERFDSCHSQKRFWLYQAHASKGATLLMTVQDDNRDSAACKLCLRSALKGVIYNSCICSCHICTSAFQRLPIYSEYSRPKLERVRCKITRLWQSLAWLGSALFVGLIVESSTSCTLMQPSNTACHS